MMTQPDFRNRISRFFEEQNLNDASDMADFIDKSLAPEFNLGQHSEDGWNRILDSVSLDLENLNCDRFDKVRKPLLSMDVVRHLASTRTKFRNKRPTFDSGLPFQLWLSRAGFFGGLQNSRSLPTTPYEGIQNVAHRLLMPEDLGKKFENAMAGEPASSNIGADVISFTGYHNALRAFYREILSVAKSRSSPWIENLPAAEEFYTRIKKLYSERAESDSEHEVYVFSTTSGLVIKEQYLGSHKLKTSEYRQSYFEFLRTSDNATIYYQFDPQSTLNSEKGLLKSKFPMEVHQQHLASFFQLPHMEISEASFSEPEMNWRREYTIVNSENDVAFSSRNSEVKEIAEGIIGAGEFFSQRDKSPYSIVRAKYRSQPKLVLKEQGISLSPEDSMKLAAETFHRWTLEFKVPSQEL